MKLTPVPVHDKPALELVDHLRDERILVAADLHIGIEHELRAAGLYVPSRGTEKIKDLIDLCTRRKVQSIILLGDVKHTVPRTSWQELRELPELFMELLEVVEKVELVPGNHDGGIKKLLPENIIVHSSRGFVKGNVGFHHGHTWPTEEIIKCEYILMAHNHPNIMFVDSLGARCFYPCWVRGALINERIRRHYKNKTTSVAAPSRAIKGEVIIMPAFGELGTGTTFNAPEPKLLGPLLRNACVDMDSARVYLLDGTFLGEIKYLRELWERHEDEPKH